MTRHNDNNASQGQRPKRVEEDVAIVHGVERNVRLQQCTERIQDGAAILQEAFRVRLVFRKVVHECRVDLRRQLAF